MTTTTTIAKSLLILNLPAAILMSAVCGTAQNRQAGQWWPNAEWGADDQVTEFLFIVTTIPFKGVTGSPVRPIAIR